MFSAQVVGITLGLIIGIIIMPLRHFLDNREK